MTPDRQPLRGLDSLERCSWVGGPSANSRSMLPRKASPLVVLIGLALLLWAGAGCGSEPEVNSHQEGSGPAGVLSPCAGGRCEPR